MEAQQQIDQRQNERLDKSERRWAIKDCKKKYKAESPRIYGEKLIDSLRTQFETNTSAWDNVILAVGSAYSTAYQHFNDVINIRMVKGNTNTLGNMVANIVQGFVIFGLGWFGPVAQEVIGHAGTEGKPKSVEDYFGTGFQDIADKSGIKFGKLPPVKYDRQKDIVRPTVTSVLITAPLRFQNSLIMNFNHCTQKMIAQLENMRDQFKDENSRASKDLRDQFGDLEADEKNPNVPPENLVPRLAGAFAQVKSLVLDMNNHLVKNSFYYSYEPGDQTKSAPFIDSTATLMERAMWAGWMPDKLRDKVVWDHCAGQMGYHYKTQGLWHPNYRFNLVKVKPGYYFDPGHPCLRHVKYDYAQPGDTLIVRLEKLGVIKTEKGPPIDKDKLTPQQIAQAQILGCAVDDKSAKKLIEWALNENRVFCRHSTKKINHVKRAGSKLFIRELA